MQTATAVQDKQDEQQETPTGQARRRGRTTPPLKRCPGASDKSSESSKASDRQSLKEELRGGTADVSTLAATPSCPAGNKVEPSTETPSARQTPVPPPEPSAGRFTGRWKQHREGAAEPEQRIVLQLSEMAGLKPQGQEVNSCVLNPVQSTRGEDDVKRAKSQLERWIDQDLLAGWRFGRTPLGEGATSVVFKASRRGGPAGLVEGAEAARAVKVFGLPETLDFPGLVREVETLREVQGHPNIVSLHGVCRVDFLFNGEQRWALVLELCTGDLFEVMRQAKMEEDRACEVTYGILSAIAFINSHGLMHRDVKVENILLKGWAQPLLADFGTAVHVSEQLEVQRRRGSPGYCAPEILLGKAYDIQCDCFSVGVCAHFLLTRKKPFSCPQEAQETTAVIKKTVNHQVDFDNDPLFNDLSKNAKDTMQLLLTKDPCHRPVAAKMLTNAWFYNVRKARGQAGPHAPMSARPVHTPTRRSSHTEGVSQSAGRSSVPEKAPQQSPIDEKEDRKTQPASTPLPARSSFGSSADQGGMSSKSTILPVLQTTCSETQIHAAATLQPDGGEGSQRRHASRLQQQANNKNSKKDLTSQQDLEDLLFCDNSFAAPQPRLRLQPSPQAVDKVQGKGQSRSSDTKGQSSGRMSQRTFVSHSSSDSSGREPNNNATVPVNAGHSFDHGRFSNYSGGYSRPSFDGGRLTGGYGTSTGDRPSFASFEGRHDRPSFEGLGQRQTTGSEEDSITSRMDPLRSDCATESFPVLEDVCSREVFQLLTTGPLPASSGLSNAQHKRMRQRLLNTQKNKGSANK